MSTFRSAPGCALTATFAVVAGRDDQIERYVAAVVVEIERAREWRRLDAVAFGGGTPSRLPAPMLGRILEALGQRFGIVPGAEVSIEANPEDWTDARAGEMREAGFTRVSLGAQSFDRALLTSLGRCHTADDIERAMAMARAAGFESVNLDLIFGSPEETPSRWAATLERALLLRPDHVSTYALSVERGTALGRLVASGAPAPDPDLQADLYELAAERLGAAGLARYEVSNHAAPGHHVRYNLSVWAGGEYRGFGMAAHSHIGDARTRNPRRLDVYLSRIERGESPVQGVERLGAWGREQERVLLGLRLAAGVSPGDAGRRLLVTGWGRRLLEAGVIEIRAGRLRVARPLLTDEVQRAVLALDPPGRRRGPAPGREALALTPGEC
jgi:putative oxygen-independent coproporphyrinogen III oxidase